MKMNYLLWKMPLENGFTENNPRKGRLIMKNLSVEKLIEINNLFNEAMGLHVIKKDDLVIVTFYDQDGDLDSTVLTKREFELIRRDFYTEILDEIVDLILDNQKMEVTISPVVENFPIFLEFEHAEYHCNFQEYQYILEEVELTRN